MSFSNVNPENVATLARLFGYEPIAAEAWIALEGQAVYNPSNPLNCLAGGVSSGMQTGARGRFAVYPSALVGLEASYYIVKTLAPMYGYGLMIAERGSGDPIAQARAIEASSWAAGHYGLTGTARGGIVTYVQSVNGAPRTGADGMLNLSGYPLSVTLAAGQPLFERPGDAQPVTTMQHAGPVQAIGRAKEPAGGWTLVKVDTAAGWPDKMERATGLYALIRP